MIISYSGLAQNNTLSDSEFSNGIEFNGISLTTIMSSNANIRLIRSYFGNEILEQSNNSAPSLAKDFYSNDISIGFEDETNSGTNYQLRSIYILNSNLRVKVQDLSVKIGDDGSMFENFSFNTNTRSFVFIDESTGSASLSFEIDNTNKVKGISLIVY